jgi:hypothetical protein
MTRRGQTEMIGVVMIAVLLIIGVLVYARVSSSGDDGALARSAAQEQEAESFLITLLSTEVPRCGTTVEGVARACIERDSLCESANPCAELQDTLDVIASETLYRFGARYNISIEGTQVMSMDSCDSGDRKTLLSVRSRQEIIGSAGMPLGQALSLAVCR